MENALGTVEVKGPKLVIALEGSMPHCSGECLPDHCLLWIEPRSSFVAAERISLASLCPHHGSNSDACAPNLAPLSQRGSGIEVVQ